MKTLNSAVKSVIKGESNDICNSFSPLLFRLIVFDKFLIAGQT